MKSKIITWVALIAVAVVSTASVSQMKKIKYSVKKMDSTWFVVDERNRPLPIEANRKDDIEWSAEGSDLLFQFPDKLSVFFTKEDGSTVGDSYYIEVKDGKKLKLKVKQDAPVGRFVYSILVKKDGTYAEGSSPPVIIIR
ncbi:MAG: hypothetical protein CL670_03800 [Balneola sp.]|jgi:hypothetical protein|nr:hypothetical protein [Balneola sp.]MBE78253.1 hypothetical protein [Balneola sp.]|tara:strand:+ start:1250 stop:1669 length:420 start_codon:yes stop_codon:yes gene_type:complete